MKMHVPPAGYRFALGDDGQMYTVPDQMQVPAQPQTEGFAYENTHAFGQHPLDRGGGIENDPAWRNFNRIPAFYTVSIILPGTPGAPVADSTPIRPEPFICKRVTWATTGDTPLFVSPSASGGSTQGRSVVAEWDDEFTKFLGSRPCLVSALFGDSQGYLDIPRGILFQGKQSLTVRLTRLVWPDSTTPQTTRWDFSFQGLGMLPKDVNQSGSAG